MVECQRDITDEYCKNIINCITTSLASGGTSKYNGCTDRIGHYEFEISKGDIKYTVVFQQDAYEFNMQVTVGIGYKTNKSELSDGYDDGIKETVKEVIDDFLCRRMKAYEANSYSEEKGQRKIGWQMQQMS